MATEDCLFCRDLTKPDACRRKMTFLTAYLRNEEPEEGSWYLNWNIRYRCRYGFGCPKLDVARIELEETARSMNAKMRHFALNASEGRFREMLRLLQGDFPAVYRQMSMWRAEGKK